jgi:hypothetical protein
MSQRVRLSLLLTLLVALAAMLFYGHSQEPSQPGVLSADTRFQPLSVKEPELRIDLLEQLQKAEYTGSKRNIFVGEAPPPPPNVAKQLAEAPRPFVGPQLPPPPPPVQVGAEFFGYETAVSGKRVAFFKNGDDVIVAAEGDTLMNRFKLVKIGNDSADVEEISSGRHATVPLTQAPGAGSADAPPN